MITAAMASSSARAPNVGAPGVRAARGEQRGNAGHEAAQDVDRDEDAADRDPDPARGLRVAADGIDPAAPDHPRRQSRTASGDRARRGSSTPAASRTGCRRRATWIGSRHALDRLAVRQPQRQPAGDAQRRERDDERVRQAARDEHDAVDGADRDAGEQHRRARRPRSARRPANASAPTTVPSASVEPTDRSMPRVTITRSWPMARTQITADWASRLPMFRGRQEHGA